MMKINIKDFEDEYPYIKPGQVRQNINGRIVLITHSEYERLFNAIQIKSLNLNDENQFQFRPLYDGEGVEGWMIRTDFPYLLKASLDIYPMTQKYIKGGSKMNKIKVTQEQADVIESTSLDDLMEWFYMDDDTNSDMYKLLKDFNVENLAKSKIIGCEIADSYREND